MPVDYCWTLKRDAAEANTAEDQMPLPLKMKQLVTTSNANGCNSLNFQMDVIKTPDVTENFEKHF